MSLAGTVLGSALGEGPIDLRRPTAPGSPRSRHYPASPPPAGGLSSRQNQSVRKLSIFVLYIFILYILSVPFWHL
ncbi:hypothetical protein DF3PA_200009 [Candidatus Defluviicoccus seviourii]|uniref:Uncharacterized protein n=1 Tax=Candidatus Defluviicoccus seviourii TaxID=2565273 RepID=A0A564WCU5_9PROT|nr:hypothetical protein DF3PA_200009 [Candidatus Defluviicoccus seviourii]